MDSSVSPLPVGMSSKAAFIVALFLSRYPPGDQMTKGGFSLEFYRAVQTTFEGTPSHSPAKHRVTNWRDYDAALRNRGSLTVWFSEEALAGQARVPQV